MEPEPPRPAPAVSAIVLAYRRPRALAEMLDRLETLPIDEVLVVHNAPDTVAVTDGRPGVRGLDPGANLGIAGRNLAAREARGEFLVMLDDDSWPLPGAVEALLAAFHGDPRLGVAGGFVHDVTEDGRRLAPNRLGSFDWFLRAGREGPAPPGGFPAFFFPEGACMVRRSAYLEVGGCFEPYFLTLTELDLATRMVANGWDVRYLPAAGFEHVKDPGGRTSAGGVLRYRIRNQLWYFWMRFPPALAARRIATYLLFDLVECAYRGAARDWLGAIAEAWRGRAAIAPHRRPLPRDVIRRAELNRGRLHVRLLAGQTRRRLARLPGAGALLR